MFRFNTIYGKIKALLITVGIFFFLLFLVLVFYKSKLEKQIIQASNEQFSNEVNSLIKLNSAFMTETVSFYSFWDEFVAAIGKKDKKWISENVITISYYQYDYICVYNKSFEIVKEMSTDQSLPEGFIPLDAVKNLYHSRFSHFYYNTSAGLMEISAASVHPTNDPEHKNSEPYGYLVIARKLDKKILAQLSAISGSKIDILSQTDSVPTDAGKTLKARVNLYSWEGKKVSTVVFNRELNLNFAATNIIMGIILVYIIIALLVSNLIARKCINKPLSLVTHILKTDNHESIAELKKAPAEYGRIGSLFEEYVTQKEELKNSKEKAEESDRLKSAFLANMSHEIRTPMNAIVGFSELVEFEPDQVKRHQYVKIIQNSSNNLLNLIVGIVDLSKIETGAVQLNYSNFLLSDLFSELKDIYTMELIKRDKNDVALDFSLPEGDPLIHSDILLIKQIISNLIGNAVKFTSKGMITFDCKRIKNEFIFCITDTGTGIPKEDQKKIFGRFIKFDYHGMNNEGTGIGLSIVEKLVNMLGGRIWLKSSYGEGSSFFFSIPYIKPTEEPVPESLKKSARGTRKKIAGAVKTILVVEDDKESLFLIKEILEPMNLIIFHVGDGREAVDFIRDNPETQLILMDMKLPFMDGDEATKTIRKFNKGVRIIAQTAFAMVGDKEKALEAGCNDYLTKPLESKKLRELVSKYLSN
jgi:signal transduction histidine kinase/CheY-like chemotaxis protein